ncbi:hypothetical protein PINS_up013836 [Pythium insidiosum]|nr:hypothetical protein PINS_up013836 [Pythium insidiosum]
MLVTLMDIRDFWFKTRWIGPTQTFSFSAVGFQALQREPLRPVTNLSHVPSRAPLPRASGWTSFFDKCDRIYPIGGSFFLHAMGENCRIGPSDSNTTVARLVFVASMRVDAVAWAACKVLRMDRRPAVCRSRLVQQFTFRYHLPEKPVLFVWKPDIGVAAQSPLSDVNEEDWITTPDSAAESEALELLDVIGNTAQLGRVVCVEGFESRVGEEDRPAVASFVGCASSDRFHSGFAGAAAPQLLRFLQNKSWLTGHWLQLFGMSFLICENSVSVFTLSNSGSLKHQTLINYSSSGSLYVAVLVVDVIMLWISLLATLEILQGVLWPALETARVRPLDALTSKSSSTASLENCEGVLTCPLLRSSPFALLMLFSQIISWLVVLASSVVWTWTEAVSGKVQAFLSTLRFWVIVLIVCIWLWNGVTACSERLAYSVARRTRIAMHEVFVVSIIAAYAKRAEIFGMSGVKAAIEHQRLADAESFEGFVAYSNAYPNQIEAQTATPPRILRVVYQPLLEVVLWSVLGSAMIALVRYIVATFFAKQSGALTAVVPETRLHPQLQASTVKRGSQSTATRAYARLDVEELLGIPIRARSLLRSSVRLELEDTTDALPSHRRIPVATFIEHGFLLDGSSLRTRRGFFRTVQFSAPSEDHINTRSVLNRQLSGLR